MWLPHVTVAAVAARNTQSETEFLCVEEFKNGEFVINQPAGHWEEGETLIEACVRETLEETGWHVTPTAFLGLSRYISPANTTYLRCSFIVEPVSFDPTAEIDTDIEQSHWLTFDQINKQNLRSPIVLDDFKKYLENIRYPLDAACF